MNSIDITGLVKKYPSFTLGPLDLHVPQGSIVGFIGENGAGKSTTLRLILGLAHPNEGDIRLFGEPSSSTHSHSHERIGVLFDDISLPMNFSVKHAGEFAKRLYQQWDSKIFVDYLQRFKLQSTKRIDELSRGMRMKLGLAMALSHHAELLIFDEATSGLDPIIRDEILDIMLEFIQDPRHSILFSSHIVSDIDKAADYVAFIHDGRLKFMEPKDALLDSWRLASLTHHQARKVAPEDILGCRKHEFGQEVIIRPEAVPQDAISSRPSIEDIMIFSLKGEEQ